MERTVFTDTGDLKPGAKVQRGGDITQLHYLINVPPHELERRIGFAPGRLRLGWYLLFLDQGVGLNDFIWGNTTENSGGTDPTKTEQFGGQQFRVAVQDIKRFEFYKNSGFDEALAERDMTQFLARQMQEVNVRCGPMRMAKVVPVIGHDDNKFWLAQYPDSPRGLGMKQWTLRHRKRFLVAAKIPATEMYRGAA